MERKYFRMRESVNYSKVAQERDRWRAFINSVLYLSQKVGNIRWTTVSFSRRTLLQAESQCSLKTSVREVHVRLSVHLRHIQTYWKSFDYLNFLGKKMCVVMINCTTRHNKWLPTWRNIFINVYNVRILFKIYNYLFSGPLNHALHAVVSGCRSVI